MKLAHKTTSILLAAIAATSLSETAYAAAGDCPQDGGKALCTEFVVKSPWKFDWCRTIGNAFTDELWCKRRGGTWNAAIPACEGTLSEVTEANFFGSATAVEMEYHSACNVEWNDSGWGVNPAPNGCFNGGTKSKGGIDYLQQRSATISTFDGVGCTNNAGSTWYMLQQTRDVVCPEGFQETTTPSGRQACVMYKPYDPKDNKGDDKPNTPPRDDPKDPPKDPDPPQAPKDPTPNPDPLSCPAPGPQNTAAQGDGGNPVNFTSGKKESVETDYTSGADGGLVFVRHYNSTGYFSFVPGGTQSYSDYWRHTYSARVIQYATNTYVSAAVQAPSGIVTVYDVSGNELQNDSPGSTHLVRVLDGGGGFIGWRQTFGSGDFRTFDTLGRLTSIGTRQGYVTTLAYNGGGQLTTISDVFGRSITLSYDAAGRLSKMTDPSSRDTFYGYDTTGRLITVTRPDSTVRTYLYEDTNWPWMLTGVIDERSARVSTFTYSATDGRVTSTQRTGPDNSYTIGYSETPTTAQRVVSDAFGSNHQYNYSKINGLLRMTSHVGPRGTRSATYDANGNILTQTDRLGHVTTFVFDAARRLETSRTEASGTTVARTTATTWHSTFDLPTQITQPSSVAGTNLVTTFSYDTAGNLTGVLQTAGSLTRQTTYTVDALGRVLTIDGPRTDVTDVTTFTYFASNDSCVGCRGQVATITNPAGQVTTFNSYNLDSKPLSVSDANGVATNYTYDARGRLETATRNSETVSYEYDAIGHLRKVTMPDGSWVRYFFDEANALIGIDDSAGNAIDYELDVRGNVVKTDIFDPQDQLRRTLQKVYDGANRHVRDVGGLGQETVYQRDGNSNITKVTDPLFNATVLGYDALDRLTNSTDPYSNSTVMTYDPLNNLATLRDPRGLTTTYTRNGLGDRTQLASPDTGTATFTYNAAGDVATRTDSRGIQTTYTRDVLGRVTSAAVTDGQVDFEYDNTVTGGAYAKGHLTKITDPSGNTQYQYDASGRVITKTQTVGAAPNTKTFVVQYGYSLGRLSSITLPSGRVVTFGFDANGRPSVVAVDGSQLLTGALYQPFGGVQKWTWSNGQIYERNRDLDGRVVSATLGPDNITYSDLSQVFGYDNLNRLISATLAAGQTRGYTYDANGNRTTAVVNASTTTYNYPGTSHKLTSLTGGTSRSFTYDNAGNTTASAGITYVYDGRGRMKQAGATTYLVNGLGQRVKKGAPDTYFAYDEAGHLIGEYDGAGTLIQELVWLGDTPVATIRPGNPTGYVFYYIWTDLLDTPRMITDVSNQARWSWTHDEPFGNSAPNENPASLGAFSFNLRFPGQYYDAETGLHYNYFRDFDPRLGRYMQSDPLGLGGGSNTFAYVGSSALVHIDPLGLDYGFGVDPAGAGGNGHTTLYFQDKTGKWYSFDQGAAGGTSSGGNLGFLSGSDAAGGVGIKPVDGPPKGTALFPSSRDTDATIANCARISQEGHRNGSYEYNLYSNNCTDAATNVLSCAGIDFYNPPFTVRPNSWFKELTGK